MSVVRVGIIGLGTVGQGVVELIHRHGDLYRDRCGHELAIVAALVRDASRPREGVPAGALLTAEADEFFAVPSEIIVEVAGGIEAARSNVRRAIESGRDVVTANKALLAAHGPELFRLASSRDRRLLFEAAVAGGVPVIRLIVDALASGRVEWFAGILNGSCNFILSEISRGGTYHAALLEAQRRGFCEADPTLDVSGDDSLHKLLILASLGFSSPMTIASAGGVPSSGITDLTPERLAAAERVGGTIKLIAFARRGGGGVIELHNGPMFVPGDSPLGRVRGSEMGLHVGTDSMSGLFIAGDGAGRFPTASAVMADVLEAARLHKLRGTTPVNRYPFDATPMMTSAPTFGTVAGFPTLPGF